MAPIHGSTPSSCVRGRRAERRAAPVAESGPQLYVALGVDVGGREVEVDFGRELRELGVDAFIVQRARQESDDAARHRFQCATRGICRGWKRRLEIAMVNT